MKKTLVSIVVLMAMVFSTVVAFAAEVTEDNLLSSHDNCSGVIMPAKTPEKEKAVEISAGIDLYNKYVGSLTGAEFYDHPVVQPSLTISHESGLYFNAWASYAPKEGFNGESYGNEVDFTLGFVNEVGPVNVETYFAFYNVISLDKWGKGDVHAFGAKLNWLVNEIVTPYLYMEYDHTDGCSEDDGLAYRVGFKIKAHKHAEIDLSGAGHTPIFGADEELLSAGKIALQFPFEVKGVSITPEVNYQKRFGYKPLEDGGEAGRIGLTKDNFWYGLKLAYTF